MSKSDAGKGSLPRPCATSNEERELRYKFAYGEITKEEFDKQYEELKKKGLIYRKF
jgi:uncharacterized membrane protein